MRLKICIIDLYDVHSALFRTFGKFDEALIVFLKRVADNCVCHLSKHYDIAIDNSIVDNLLESNPNINPQILRGVVAVMRENIREHHAKHPELYKEYFTVYFDDGLLYIDLKQPEVPVQMSCNYEDVPWGAPPGTIIMKHMEKVIGAIKYVWSDDTDGEVDIIVNNVMYTISSGLWKIDGAKPEQVDLERYKQSRMEEPRSSMNFVRRRGGVDIYRSPVKVPTIDNPTIRMIGKRDYLEIDCSGDYGNVGVHRANVIMVIPKGKKKYVPYTVYINDTMYDVDGPGMYVIGDDELIPIPQK